MRIITFIIDRGDGWVEILFNISKIHDVIDATWKQACKWNILLVTLSLDDK